MFSANLISQSGDVQPNTRQAYEELKAAKEDEIAAGQSQIDAKTQELADTDEKNAQVSCKIMETFCGLGTCQLTTFVDFRRKAPPHPSQPSRHPAPVAPFVELMSN